MQSLASTGGFVVGRKALMDIVAVFGLPNAPHISNINVAAALGALRLLRREPLRVRDLQHKIAYARRCLAEKGLKISQQGAALIHIPLAQFEDVYAYLGWRVLRELGIYTQVSIYPMALGQTGPRFAITSAMSYEDIDYIVAGAGRMMKILSRVQFVEVNYPVEMKQKNKRTDFLSFAMSFGVF